MRIRTAKPFTSAVYDMIGQDLMATVGGATTDSAVIRGSRFALTDSLSRMNELNNIRNYVNPDVTQADRDQYDEAYNTIGQRRLSRHGKGRYGLKNLPWTTEQFEENYPDFEDNLEMMEPDAANEKYGIEGQLQWSEPVSSLEAYVLNQRKQEEIKFNFALDKAYGLEFAKGMGIEMGMALIDPVSIPLYFIPPLGAAKVVGQLGLQGSKFGSRFVTGGLAGLYGTAAMEPFIYGAAQQEQANYGLAQSFMNITFGTIAGGGLHSLGGAVVDGVKYISAKRHGQALNSAAKQLANGESVEVTPITNIENGPTYTTPLNDADTLDFGSPSGARDTVPDAADGAAHTAGKTENFKPHSDPDESIALIRKGEKAAKLSGVKLKNAMQDDPEFAAAVREANKEGVTNKVAFKVRTAQGDYIVPKGEGGELRLFDSGQLKTDVGDGLQLGEKAHMSMLMHGVDMAAADVRYTGSTKLEDGSIHHIFEVNNAEFNPKMNQNEVTIASPNDVLSLFQGDKQIGAFADDLAAGKKAVLDEYAKFDEGKLLSDAKKQAFDEQILDENLQQTGPQQGTQKGGTYIDAATGQEYYVKYPSNPDIAKNEFLAATLYRMFGVAFPETKLVANAQGDVVGIASEIAKGAKMITPDEFAALPADVKKGFADDLLVDMFLGNWDVVGNAPNFNLMLSPSGTVFRLDPGGALVFRAQGALKPDSYTAGTKIEEFETFFDAKTNPNVKKVIDAMGMSQQELDDVMAKTSARIFEADPSEIGEIVDIVGFTPDVADKVKSFLVNRRQALIDNQYSTKKGPDFSRVYQNVEVKKGKIVATSMSSATKTLSKLAEDMNPTLTTQQKAILKHYTSSGYKWLNGVLRGTLKPKSYKYEIEKAADAMGIKLSAKPDDAEMLDIVNKYANMFNLAMTGNKGISAPATVWRGGTPYTAFNNVKGLNLSGVKDLQTAKAMKGGTVQLAGFTSTGVHRSKANSFMKSGESIMLQINLPKGQKGLASKQNQSWSYGTGETEFILPKDTTFFVKEVKGIGTNGKFIIELDALAPGQMPPKPLSKKQAIKVAAKYHAQPSNAVSDVLPDDPDLSVDGDIVQTTLKADSNSELAAQTKTIEELNEMIQAELANVDPKYVKALTKELEQIEVDGKADIEMANDLFEAAKAAAVCVRGAS